jgi:hemerythrin superfamily protein
LDLVFGLSIDQWTIFHTKVNTVNFFNFLDLYNTLDSFNFVSFNVEGNINDMDVEAFILFQVASIVVVSSKEFFTATEMVEGAS